jgi:hypothetical protein
VAARALLKKQEIVNARPYPSKIYERNFCLDEEFTRLLISCHAEGHARNILQYFSLKNTIFLQKAAAVYMLYVRIGSPENSPTCLSIRCEVFLV